MNILIVQEKVNKDRAAQLLGLEVYDTALPQEWLDQFVYILRKKQPVDYHLVLSSFVWCYDNGSFMGYPYPLTVQAFAFLKLYDQLTGSSYTSSETYNVLEVNV